MLVNAQGEDVVAGIRTPIKLADLGKTMPAIYDQLCAVRAILEIHYGEMQDLEFTFERGKLYMLQCRTGKRAPAAAFRIAVEQAALPLMTADRSPATLQSWLPAAKIRRGRIQARHHERPGASNVSSARTSSDSSTP